MSEALPMMKDLEQSCSSANLGRDGIEQVSKSLEVVSMSTDALVSHVYFSTKNTLRRPARSMDIWHTLRNAFFQ